MKEDEKVAEAKVRVFGRRAKEFRERLDEEPDNEFKVAILEALQHMEQYAHKNNLIGLSLLDHAVTCYLEGEDDYAKLLMYVSGATVNIEVTRSLLIAISALTASKN